jgi:hypothetical protein
MRSGLANGLSDPRVPAIALLVKEISTDLNIGSHEVKTVKAATSAAVLTTLDKDYRSCD